MSRPLTILGLWRVSAYEENGIHRSNEQVEAMAHLLILSDKPVRDSDGIWGSIAYSGLPNAETVERSSQTLRRLIEGQRYEAPVNFHVYSGGILRLGSEDGINCIDFVVHHGPSLSSIAIEPVNRGIYSCDGKLLRLSLCESSVKERPAAFDSRLSPYHSLATYVRELL